MPDYERGYGAFQEYDRGLQKIHDERLPLHRQRQTVEDEANLFSLIGNDVQTAMDELCLGSDDSWKSTLLNHNSSIQHHRGQGFQMACGKLDELEERERELYRAEVAAERKYGQTKRDAR